MPDLQAIGFASDSSVWTAFIPSNEDRTARDGFTVAVVARLKPGVTSAKAQRELDLLSARLSAAYPEAHPNWSLHVTPLKTFLLGDTRTPLTILFCAVGFVLLIACANVSSLFLSRNWSRQREFAIRLAIGAPRSAILRQLAVESFLVALGAGLCALVCAWGSLHGLRSMLPPEIPRLQNLRLDGQVAGFTLAASFIAAILSGVGPAFLSVRGEATRAIKNDTTRPGLSASRAGHGLLRRSLVIAEVALSVILLLGATLAVRSLSHLLHLDLGFKTDHVLTLHLDFPKFRYANSAQAITFVHQVLEGVRAVPGIDSASAGLVFPMSDEIAGTLFETEATASDPKLGEQGASANRVTPDFFRTLGIPLLAGRDFSSTDTSGHPLVFIVNETLARKYFGTIDVVGKRLSPRKESGHPIWGEIIGVAANVRDANLREEPKPQVYASFYQTRIALGVYLVVLSNLDSASIVPAIQQRIWAVEPHQPVTRVATLEQRISAVNATPRSQSFLLGVFAMLGVLLALIGLYGVIAYMVSLQTHEIGVRMAIGATLAQILRLVLIQGIKVTLPGIAIGIAGGIVLTRFMSSLLFGIGALDPLTFACVPFLLAFACLLACWIPARRATKVDPMAALRYE
jgi:putative ABC transport system permease protein